ncbi:hypothetical protein N7G274_003320 [Stereocaulon virgatum]|uniref:Tyrosine specific protein phosphatases domain-containing protein n=1 Tax=Stereocaulon virgatum TaxID=373712 RepID=A0ABR4AFB0_9LECA
MSKSALPSPPFIKVEGVHNFRGLYLPHPKSPTTTITITTLSPPNAILYRSASRHLISETGISTLKSLSITTIYDLRSHPEASKTSDPPIPNISTIHAPVFSQIDYSPEAIALRFKNYTSNDGVEGFVAAYNDILSSGGNAFGEVLRFLRDHPTADGTEKCLVHCSAGKDRTGVLCALILLLVGVGEEDIADEYALSEIGLEGIREEMVERLSRMEGINGDREGVERMVGSRREVMLAVIEMGRGRGGGVEGYLKGECGLSEEDLGRIRKNILGEG